MESGTATITINALRTLWRKIKQTNATIRMASIRSITTEFAEAFVYTESSEAISNFTLLAAYSFSTAFNSSLASSATFTALASLCFCMEIPMASLPSIRLISFCSATPSSTSATSITFIFPPLGVVAITVLRSSFRLEYLAARRTEYTCSAFSTFPAGISILAVLMADSTCKAESLYAFSFSASMFTLI